MCMLGFALEASAQSVDGVGVSGLDIERNGKYISVDMNMDISSLDVESNRAVLLTPCLVNGNDSVELPSVGVYGRRRYYYYVRNGESMLSGSDEMTYRASSKPDTVGYHALVPFKKWMDGASLTLHRADYGCCGSLLAEQNSPLGHYNEAFFPTLVYSRPTGQAEKRDSIESSAYVEFPVNKSEIYAEYRNNAAELYKIRAAIDSVRSDQDITIRQVSLKGYASPDGPYANNAMLAKGRTAALKAYIQNLYKFGSGVIATGYEPEDWAGLRRYVDNSNLEHRAEMLAIIDSSLDPDVKEQRIKANCPDDYRFLLHNSYPALRHIDYSIAYVVRTYNDVDEIKRVMQSQPQKLSLNEFYLLSEQYEPGTDEFTEVFETAVRMYPNDESANLNAANAALRRDDLKKAARYLDKAGSSADAVYARAALAIRSEDYTTARALLSEAAGMGMEQAAATLSELDKRQ